MTYGSETWALTKVLTQKLASAQRSMERKIIGLTWQDMKTSKWIRSQTKCKDITKVIKRLKWEWAGHLARRQDNRWCTLSTLWTPPYTRGRGRPAKRWSDELMPFAGNYWYNVVLDRGLWHVMGKAFVQQWMPLAE